MANTLIPMKKHKLTDKGVDSLVKSIRHQMAQMKKHNTSVELAKKIARFERDLCMWQLQPSSLLPDTDDSWRIYFLKYLHEFKKWKIQNENSII